MDVQGQLFPRAEKTAAVEKPTNKEEFTMARRAKHGKLVVLGTLALGLGLILAGGCTTTTTGGLHGQRMPDWYMRSDLRPSQDFYYFCGYSEAAFSYGQAIAIAEANARQRIASFLGTDVVAKTEKEWGVSGTNWSTEGVLSELQQETYREKVVSMVNELVRYARVEDSYVEQVTIKRFLSPAKRRFNGGVKIEFPFAEVERLKEKIKQEIEGGVHDSEALRKAETLWKTGQRSEAIEIIRVARRRNPLNGEISYALGQYLEDAGQKDEANRVFSELAALKDGSDWSKRARAKVRSSNHAVFEDMLELLGEHGLTGVNLLDLFGYTKDGQYSRARGIAKQSCTHVTMAKLPDLVIWHVIAAAEVKETPSLDARADLRTSASQLQEALKTVSSVDQAEPAVAMLLSLIQQDIGTEQALKCLADIQRQIPLQVQFSESIRNLSVVALGQRQDRQSQKMLKWLNPSI